MKIPFLIITIAFLTTKILAQDNYYWYKNNKIPLEEVTSKKYILLDSSIDTVDLKQKLKDRNVKVKKIKKSIVYSSVKPYKSKKNKNIKWALVENVSSVNNNLKNIEKVNYVAPFYKLNGSMEAGLSHIFYVKLKQSDDIKLLEKIAQKNKVDIIGSNQYMPLWYTLACSKKSNGNALEMANIFYETYLFAASEPDLMTDDPLLCSNDTYFVDQWYLSGSNQNIGNEGNDINYCEAKTITQGNHDIVIAVIDHGVELDHPDLTNMYHLSYDSENDTSPSYVYGIHGTPVAGIIGATSDNNLGISGIAPNCPIMSISNKVSWDPESINKRGDAINWAWQNGADVINNSWKTSYQNRRIDDAISNALILGRNGKGCVVVFSAGNGNRNKISYPANSNVDIITVGATSQCNERKSGDPIETGVKDSPFSISCDGQDWWGSNFGPELDIMAPGVFIPTTDRQGGEGYNEENGIAGNYYLSFGGTSSAAPQVAAVAGLILSINPNLTQKEVSDMIEKTAQKVGHEYMYRNINGRNNGTWNEEMGYGLVDAYAAVVAAQNSLPPAPPVPPDCPDNITLPNTTISSGATETHQASNTIENSTTYIIEDGGTVTLKAKEIILNQGFEAEEGSTFEATVEPCE